MSRKEESTSSSPPVQAAANDDPITAVRDRFQASAREIIRNIESAIGKGVTTSPVVGTNDNGSGSGNTATTPLEQAFRSFFTSCTTGAAMATTNDDSSAADVTPVSSQPSQESSLSSQSLRSLPLANLGRRATTHTQDTLRRLSKPALREGVEGGAVVGTPVADHIYEHLFFAEEQARREQQQQQQHHTPRQLSNRIPDELPRNRRQRSPPSLSAAAARTGIHSPNVQPKKRHTGSTNLSKPFPVSSPNRDKPVLSVASPPLPCTAHGISIPQCPTFDDGISAISANTLEAMAKHPPQQRQQATRAAAAVATTPNSTSQFPRVTVHNDYGPTKPRNQVQHNRRPPSRNEPTIRMFPTLPCSPPRGGTGAGLTTSSAGTMQVVNIVHASNFSPPRCQRSSSVTSPVRHGTPQSRSTRTSHSSGGTSKLSFENWQSVEQQFWESVVQEDSDVKKKKKRHVGSSSSSRRRHSEHQRYRRGDATLSTASSTAATPSRSSSWLEKHPHDTVSYEPSDFFASTALYPDDEEAEI